MFEKNNIFYTSTIISKRVYPVQRAPALCRSGEECQWQALPSPMQCEETATRTRDLLVTGGKTLQLAPGPPFTNYELSEPKKKHSLIKRQIHWTAATGNINASTDDCNRTQSNSKTWKQIWIRETTCPYLKTWRIPASQLQSRETTEDCRLQNKNVWRKHTPVLKILHNT